MSSVMQQPLFVGLALEVERKRGVASTLWCGRTIRPYEVELDLEWGLLIIA